MARLRAIFPTFAPGSGGYTFGYYARVILVMFLWALCFPLIAVGLSTAAPLSFAALRAFIAGIGLLIPAFVLRRPTPRGRQTWLMLAGIGLGSTTLGFAGMFVAGGLVSPGLATVLANVQPLVAAGLAYFALGEPVHPRQRSALLLGFAGIVVTALPGLGAGGEGASLIGIGAILLAALGVAAGNVLMKRLAGQLDPLMATGWQFVIGSIPLFLLARIFEGPVAVSWNLPFIATLLTLSLVGTSLAFALWFALLRQGSLNQLNTFTFLTPVFALLIGATFFSEHLDWLEVVGISLIVGSALWVGQKHPDSSALPRQ